MAERQLEACSCLPTSEGGQLGAAPSARTVPGPALAPYPTEAMKRNKAVEGLRKALGRRFESLTSPLMPVLFWQLLI